MIDQAEFAALHGLAQGADQGRAHARRGVHGFGVDHVGLAAAILGLVHGRVGELEQVGRRLRVVGIEADADRRRNDHVLAVVQFERLLERGDQLHGDALGLAGVGQFLEHDREFVATDAGHGIAIADVVAQAAAGRLEHAVAGGMAHRIVDVLEAIEIEEQHGDLASAAARADHGMAEPLGKQGAVGQAGQGVVVGQVAQLLLGALALGDIGQHADVMRALALRVAHLGALQPAQEFLAVLAALPQLAAPEALAHDRIAQVLVVLGGMLCAVEQGHGTPDDLVFLPAGDAGEGRVHRNELEVEIADRDRLAHAADHFLDDAALALGFARCGDVARGAANAQRSALLVALDDLAARQHPDPFVLADAHALLGFEQGHLVADVVVETLGDGALVVRVHVFAHPVVDRVDFLALAGLGARRAEADQHAGVHVEIPEFVAGSPQGQAQALLAVGQLTLVLALGLALAPHRPADCQSDQQGGARIGHPHRPRVPPGRPDFETDRGSALVPVPVVVAGQHAETVLAGVEVGVGGLVARAGIDPVVVEALEAIAEAVALGGGIV